VTIEDAQVEQQWCGDVSRLTDKLGQRGLTLALLRAEPAGKQPVRRLTRKATGRRRAAEHAVVRALPTQPS
jgi:hypothetical protein